MLSFTGKTAFFEDWYSAIQEFTPNSHMLKVDPETKKVIMAQTYEKLSISVPYFSEMNSKVDTTGLDETSLLTTLTQKLDQLIQGREVFFRTNVFSPKDVKSPSLVSSGEEALALLLSSERMHKGYTRILGEHELILIVREKVDYHEEFRCFVKNGHLQGISQYEDSRTLLEVKRGATIFDLEQKDYVMVYHYLNHLIRQANILDAVIDVGLTPTGLSTIELNPYGRYTDKSLFASTDIYNMEPTGVTQIRYWSDEQTITTLEVEDGKVTHSFDEWYTLETISKDSQLDNIKNALKNIRLGSI